MCSYQKRNPFPIRIPICLTQLFQRTFALIIEIAQRDKGTETLETLETLQTRFDSAERDKRPETLETLETLQTRFDSLSVTKGLKH